MATEGQEDALAAATAAAAASECQGLLVSTRFFEVFVYIHGANVGAVVGHTMRLLECQAINNPCPIRDQHECENGETECGEIVRLVLWQKNYSHSLNCFLKHLPHFCLTCLLINTATGKRTRFMFQLITVLPPTPGQLV